MSKAPPLAPEHIRKVYEYLKDPLATYAQAAVLHDIHHSTARRIACGEYEACPEPLLRFKKPATTGENVKRGVHLSPEADAAINKYCEKYLINRSSFISHVVMAFDKKQQEKE